MNGRLSFGGSSFKCQKAVYFVFIMICNKSLVFYQPHAHMKKTLLSILTLVVYFLGSFSASAEDHKHKLHEIGERIKQAVKAGKITEKEGWAKWHAVLREHGDHDDHDDHHDEGEWEEVEELEREIEIRELEFELERLEHEHEMQRMALNHERERMERDFDRERRQWEMEKMQWDMRRKQMEMQMRAGPRSGGMPPHGMKFPNLDRAGPKPDLRRGAPPRGMNPSMRRGQGHGHPKKLEDFKRDTASSISGKSDCPKSSCGKSQDKLNCDKKDSCKQGTCNKSDSCKKKKHKK